MHWSGHKEGYADVPPVRSGHLYIKDSRCAVTNEKTNISVTKEVTEDAQKNLKMCDF